MVQTSMVVSSRVWNRTESCYVSCILIFVGLTMIISRNLLSIVTTAVLLVMLSACSKQPSKAEGPAAAVQTNSYEAVGTVKGIDSKLPGIEIDHGDIPGLMPAMQMQFHVKD